MYIKVSTGTSFSAAAQYNEAGISDQQQQQKSGKVRFLDCYNLGSEDAKGIAAEMGAVASRSRTQQPVWNVSFSAADGQALTDQQWLGVVERYMTEIGTSTDRHQVAVWRHSDTGRDHVHALINAVPTDGQRALKRYQCGIRAKQAAQRIDTSLAQPILKGIGIREIIGQALKTTLRAAKPTTFDELVADLSQVGIRAVITTNAKGGGTSFQKGDHKPVKGSAVGYKYKHLVEQLAANRLAYEQEIAQLRQEKAQADEGREKAQADQQQAERAQEQAHKERDEARNQVPKTLIGEVSKADPTDRQTIERLRTELGEANERADFFYGDWEHEKARADELQGEQDRLRKQPPPPVAIRTVVKPDPADKAEIDTLRWENTIQKQQIHDLTKRLETTTKQQVHQLVAGVAKQKLTSLAAFYQGLARSGLVVKEIDGVTLEISQKNASLWPMRYRLASLSAALATNARQAKAVSSEQPGPVVADAPPTQTVPSIAPIAPTALPVLAAPSSEQLSVAERVVWAGRRDCRHWADLISYLTEKGLQPAIDQTKAGVDVLTVVVGEKRMDVAKLHAHFSLQELRATVEFNQLKHGSQENKGPKLK